MSRISPLEPDSAEMVAMAGLVTDRVTAFVTGLPDRPVHGGTDPAQLRSLVASCLAPPAEGPGELTSLLDRLDDAVLRSRETAGPGYLAHVPGGGLFTSALAEFYTRAVNRHGGMAIEAPGLAAIEESVLRWMAGEVCGFGPGSGGLLTTGASMANFSALVTARHALLGEDISTGTVYVTGHTHHSVAKAARLAGIRSRHMRVVPTNADLEMDPVAFAELVRADRAAGLRPFFVVGSAGTTDTGAVDPLRELAAAAGREGLWFHVDAAYGGFFRLTDRGRNRLDGIGLADSVSLDPHKSLFLPFGTGALVVRDPAALQEAHEGTADYLAESSSAYGVPDYAQRGPELTREVRGLRVWLPLHLHGVSAFRAALDEKLDLAQRADAELRTLSSLELPWRPRLSTVAFRVRARGSTVDDGVAADRATRELIGRVNLKGRVLLAGTVIGGRYTARLCVLSHRTHDDRITEAVDTILTEAA